MRLDAVASNAGICGQLRFLSFLLVLAPQTWSSVQASTTATTTVCNGMPDPWQCETHAFWCDADDLFGQFARDFCPNACSSCIPTTSTTSTKSTSTSTVTTSSVTTTTRSSITTTSSTVTTTASSTTLSSITSTHTNTQTSRTQSITSITATTSLTSGTVSVSSMTKTSMTATISSSVTMTTLTISTTTRTTSTSSNTTSTASSMTTTATSATSTDTTSTSGTLSSFTSTRTSRSYTSTTTTSTATTLICNGFPDPPQCQDLERYCASFGGFGQFARTTCPVLCNSCILTSTSTSMTRSISTSSTTSSTTTATTTTGTPTTPASEVCHFFSSPLRCHACFEESTLGSMLRVSCHQTCKSCITTTFNATATTTSTATITGHVAASSSPFGESVVSVMMVIRNLDFSGLVADLPLLSLFEAAVVDALAFLAGSGVEVQRPLTLTPASVLLRAELVIMRSPGASTAEGLAGRLAGSSHLGQYVLDAIKRVSGIFSISTGTIHITDIEVSLRAVVGKSDSEVWQDRQRTRSIADYLFIGGIALVIVLTCLISIRGACCIRKSKDLAPGVHDSKVPDAQLLESSAQIGLQADLKDQSSGSMLASENSIRSLVHPDTALNIQEPVANSLTSTTLSEVMPAGEGECDDSDSSDLEMELNGCTPISRAVLTPLSQACLPHHSTPRSEKCFDREFSRQGKAAYEGAWASSGQFVALISGGIICCSDGCRISIRETSTTSCEMTIDGITYQAVLSRDGDSLVWDDGEIWTRASEAAFELEFRDLLSVDDSSEMLFPL